MPCRAAAAPRAHCRLRGRTGGRISYCTPRQRQPLCRASVSARTAAKTRCPQADHIVEHVGVAIDEVILVSGRAVEAARHVFPGEDRGDARTEAARLAQCRIRACACGDRSTLRCSSLPRDVHRVTGSPVTSLGEGACAGSSAGLAATSAREGTPGSASRRRDIGAAAETTFERVRQIGVLSASSAAAVISCGRTEAALEACASGRPVAFDAAHRSPQAFEWSSLRARRHEGGRQHECTGVVEPRCSAASPASQPFFTPRQRADAEKVRRAWPGSGGLQRR